MKKSEKLSMEEMIKKIDESKKVNPLDLSSDQDLTIALMNLISLEEHFFFSGAKTKNTSFYELMDTMRDMRKDLMARVVKKNSEGAEVWCISKHLLATSMRLMEVGTKANSAGKKEDAYDMFQKAYDLYSIFWGLNMDLIDASGVKKLLPNYDVKTTDYSKKETEIKTEKSEKKSGKSEESLISRLGNWVKDTVNCCIE